MRKRYRVSFDLLLDDTNENEAADWILDTITRNLESNEDIEELACDEVPEKDIQYPSGESNCQYHDKG